ncbi:unnamed protein product, partial [Meganyctiphanes norvegica]
ENYNNHNKIDSKIETENCLSKYNKNNNSQTDLLNISNNIECVEKTNEIIPFKSEIIHSSNTALAATRSSSTAEIIPPTPQLESMSISGSQYDVSENQTVSKEIQFKSYIPEINTQQDIDNDLGYALNYQYMFEKRTSPWEMKDWDQDELNAFVIEVENIDRLYHMVADDVDPNVRSWEICCRMDYNGEKYFVEMYSSCDYTGFDCQGGGLVSITKLPDFFLNNIVNIGQISDRVYKALLDDGYRVQEPDPLHKMHPKFWNNAPMLKFLCHNAIYNNREKLSHFKEELPQIL